MALLSMLGFNGTGCQSVKGIGEERIPSSPPVPRPTRAPDKTIMLDTAGYCPCEICCQWEHTHWGKTIYSAGPNRGFPMKVGETATGLPMRYGTIAANPDVFPYGTIMEIPGYGVGRVEDDAGNSTAGQVDLHFTTHAEAEAWGRQMKNVRVWLP